MNSDYVLLNQDKNEMASNTGNKNTQIWSMHSPQLKKLILERILEQMKSRLASFIKNNSDLVNKHKKSVNTTINLKSPSFEDRTKTDTTKINPTNIEATSPINLLLENQANSTRKINLEEDCTPERLVKFLDGFLMVNYLLEALQNKFPEIGDCPKMLQSKLQDHVVKELDSIVEDGQALIRLHGNFDFASESAQNILSLINVAVNYDIQYFMAHPAIQSVLNTHGMKSIMEDWRSFMISPLVFVFYPVFRLHGPLEKYPDDPIINACFKVYETLLVIPVAIFYNNLSQLPPPQYSYVPCLIFIFLWWVSYTYFEIKQMRKWSSLFNKPFKHFSIENFIKAKENFKSSKENLVEIEQEYEKKKENSKRSLNLAVRTASRTTGRFHVQSESEEKATNLKLDENIENSVNSSGKLRAENISKRKNNMSIRRKNSVIKNNTISELPIDRRKLRELSKISENVKLGTDQSLKPILSLKRSPFAQYLSPEKAHSSHNTCTLNREHYEANEFTIQKFMMTSSGGDQLSFRDYLKHIKNKDCDEKHKLCLDSETLEFAVPKKSSKTAPNKTQINLLSPSNTQNNSLNPFRHYKDKKKQQIEEIYRNSCYFRHFWTKIDWVVIICYFLFFILRSIYTIFPDEDLNVWMRLFYSTATMLLLFRVMEHFGNLLPVLGPFVRAFVRIFSVTSLFLSIITVVAASCAVMLSNFICRAPTLKELSKIESNVTRKMCEQAFVGHHNFGVSGGLSGHQSYFQCTFTIFRYFILEPMDNYGIIHYGKEHYGILKNSDLLECYGAATEGIVVVVMSFYYLTVIFALMRGVLVKYLLHSKGEETKITAVHRARSYIRCLFQIAPHPPPWNIIFLVAELVAKICQYFCENRLDFKNRLNEVGSKSLESKQGRKNSNFDNSNRSDSAKDSFHKDSLHNVLHRSGSMRKNSMLKTTNSEDSIKLDPEKFAADKDITTQKNLKQVKHNPKMLLQNLFSNGSNESNESTNNMEPKKPSVSIEVIPPESDSRVFKLESLENSANTNNSNNFAVTRKVSRSFSVTRVDSELKKSISEQPTQL